MRIVYPKLTLVGAGPGDPELISLKGIKALESANAVLYDALVHPGLLDYVPENAIKEYVGKRAGAHSSTQQEINRLIAEYALKYGHVVRLKGGDPFIFGRGFEEIEYAERFDIETAVVPGISTSTSLTALNKIPLTMRGINEGFRVMTGTTQIDNLSKDFQSAVDSNATIVILMGFNKLAQIVAAYKALGKDEMPIAVIQNGSLPDEVIAAGTIDSIQEVVEAKGMSTPAIIVVGEVVRLYQKEQVTKSQKKIA